MYLQKCKNTNLDLGLVRLKNKIKYITVGSSNVALDDQMNLS